MGRRLEANDERNSANANSVTNSANAAIGGTRNVIGQSTRAEGKAAVLNSLETDIKKAEGRLAELNQLIVGVEEKFAAMKDALAMAEANTERRTKELAETAAKTEASKARLAREVNEAESRRDAARQQHSQALASMGSLKAAHLKAAAALLPQDPSQ